MHHTPALAAITSALTWGAAACSGPSAPITPQPPETSAAATASGVRNISIEDAQALMASDASVKVLDVRTPEEFAAGRIAGAVNVDFLRDDFAAQLAKLDPQATYLLYCRSGNRSAKALELMKQQGFAKVAHMTDGFSGWTAAGRGVVTAGAE